MLGKTFKGASFLQLTATSKLQNVLGILKAKAQQTHSARLALLASQVQNALPEGAFTTVLEEIEKMFEKLKGEAASDKKKKDHCKAEYHSITQKSNNYAFLIQKKSAKIETLEKLGSTSYYTLSQHVESHEECTQIDVDRVQPGFRRSLLGLEQRFRNKMSALESEKAAAAAEVAEIDADLEKATSHLVAICCKYPKYPCSANIFSVLRDPNKTLYVHVPTEMSCCAGLRTKANKAFLKAKVRNFQGQECMDAWKSLKAKC